MVFFAKIKSFGWESTLWVVCVQTASQSEGARIYTAAAQSLASEAVCFMWLVRGRCLFASCPVNANSENTVGRKLWKCFEECAEVLELGVG